MQTGVKSAFIFKFPVALIAFGNDFMVLLHTFLFSAKLIGNTEANAVAQMRHPAAHATYRIFQGRWRHWEVKLVTQHKVRLNRCDTVRNLRMAKNLDDDS